MNFLWHFHAHRWCIWTIHIHPPLPSPREQGPLSNSTATRTLRFSPLWLILSVFAIAIFSGFLNYLSWILLGCNLILCGTGVSAQLVLWSGVNGDFLKWPFQALPRGSLHAGTFIHEQAGRQAINNTALPFIPCWHGAQVSHTECPGLPSQTSAELTGGLGHAPTTMPMLFCIAKNALSSAELSGTAPTSSWTF